ncbi:helix-turn-helix transcriptional regulator [Cysteiniphilum sp. QT6929]|uniref:helix-turn-helix transcriptional regulator n=1 Tax=Cysteiniphilum sp. QT6929 TaxID=2975055 RepID=UPI0024B3AB6F|nr:helix-turn-helix transcriptional regulator [Cysteiniphilum sp. QT6929]WHN66044.1 helix-turn-helix transcriptional regulator [Cysteiniphilum sp. QT6929]
MSVATVHGVSSNSGISIEDHIEDFCYKLNIVAICYNDLGDPIKTTANFDLINLPLNEFHSLVSFESLSRLGTQYITHEANNQVVTLRLNVIYQCKHHYWIGINIAELMKLPKSYQQILKHFAKQIPIANYVKDAKGIYMYGNEYVCHLANVKSINNKTDHDLIWHNHAEHLTQNDYKVIGDIAPNYFFETVTIDSKQTTFLSIKTSDGLDLYGSSINLSFIHAKLLQQMEQIPIDVNDTSLSPHEFECAYWMSQGKSAWEIAQLTNRSQKTVEWYLAKLRKKLHCKKASSLAFLLGKYHTNFVKH